MTLSVHIRTGFVHNRFDQPCVVIVCRMKPKAPPKLALYWTGDSKRTGGLPKETWQRIKRELKDEAILEHHG